ncbi:predicted GPI-anchored protein 58 [Coturnix japonica]|uniref:predicted GPI-anchored protein 58 n=1 Tax=Coturnix japonica TaxID=93934 RepID=UPI0013A5D54D|nr:predicted GPI-anchored protein 58 [Coturnix japonica]
MAGSSRRQRGGGGGGRGAPSIQCRPAARPHGAAAPPPGRHPCSLPPAPAVRSPRPALTARRAPSWPLCSARRCSTCPLRRRLRPHRAQRSSSLPAPLTSLPAPRAGPRRPLSMLATGDSPSGPAEDGVGKRVLKRIRVVSADVVSLSAVPPKGTGKRDPVVGLAGLEGAVEGGLGGFLRASDVWHRERSRQRTPEFRSSRLFRGMHRSSPQGTAQPANGPSARKKQTRCDWTHRELGYRRCK